MKYILIEKVSAKNKGAELMLRSILDRYAENKNVRFVIRDLDNPFSKKEKIKLKLYSLIILQRFKIDFSDFFLKDRNLLNEFLVKQNKINVVFDAAGFQFGDQWLTKLMTKQKILKRINFYRRLKSQGAQIIFLPQAIGPFNKKLSAFYFQEMYKISDIFFVRDKQSLNYSKILLKDNKKIFSAPDFTSSLSCSDMFNSNKYICIIPNYKMVSHSNDQIANKYVNFLKFIINIFKVKYSEKVVLLNHESSEDKKLIDEINQGFSLQVYDNLNAIQIKKVISNSKLLISSRYHGLISGLSQGIPSLCTGWSHKYTELMKDYNLNNSILDVLDFESSEKNIDFYYNNLDEISKNIILKSESFKLQTIKMWELVDKKINLK